MASQGSPLTIYGGGNKGVCVSVDSNALQRGAGAAIAAALLGGLLGPWLAGVISFGLAALLYLVTEELLVEAHEVKETHPATAMFFVGFLTLIVIDVDVVS